MPPARTGPDRNSSSSATPLIRNSLDTTLASLNNPGLGSNSNSSSNSNNNSLINHGGSSLSQETYNTMPNANNMLVNGRGSGGSGRSGASKPSGGSSSSASLQQLPRPSSTARGNVAAFLTKLYNMVGDEASNNLIKWSDDGQSFIVVRHVEFAKEVLPKFFKHNNFSSFVRQLNMYGFHKVPHLQQGVLLPDVDSEEWEFSNPHFQKNQPDLLCLVSRKKASNGSEDKDALTMDLGHILTEVTAIKKHQIAISSDLKNIERDHQSLWQESIAARERHQRQQDTIDKILRFLASVFSGEKKRAIVPNKKPRLTITEGDVEDEYENDNSQGSGGEHEEEVTKLLGSKRKRASMVQSEADYTLPGMESQGSPSTKPTFNISEMTPATLALLANANQSAQTKPAPSFVTPVSVASTSNTTTSQSTSSTSNSNGIPTTSTSSAAAAPLPDYLSSTFPGLHYSNLPMQQGQQLPFKLDASNLPIPTLLPSAMISSAHHDMLQSISMANAQESNPAPLPPSFVQTPAGANVVKGVDQIAREMEQLQKSIEALEAHGLNVNDFHFDESYLDPASFDSSGYHHLGNISESGIPYQDDPLGSEGDAMTDLIQLNADQDDLNMAMNHQHLSSGQGTPVITTPSANSSLPSTPHNSTIPSTPCALSSVPTTCQAMSSSNASSPAPSTSVSSPTVAATPVSSTVPATPKETPPANPRTPTVGEEYLEDLLELDAT